VRCELTKSFLDCLTNAPFPPIEEMKELDHDECLTEVRRTRHKAFSERSKCKSVEEHQRDFEKPADVLNGEE